jgi:hypothetical protein
MKGSGEMGVLTVVPTLTPGVKAFCRGLNPDKEPLKVPARVAPGCFSNQCLGNVQTYVARFGGRPYYGWSIWSDELTVEGIPHVIWVKPSGYPIDITPHENEEKRILFVPSSTQCEEVLRVASREVAPLIDHPLVDEYVELVLERDRLTTEHCGKRRDGVLPRQVRRDLDRRMEKLCAQVLKNGELRSLVAG